MVKTKLYNGFNIKPQHKNSILLIGNFDGVHLGHQKLFSLTQYYKKKYSLKDAAQAHKDLEARLLTGPAVIIP